jgi:hypothetical protein
MKENTSHNTQYNFMKSNDIQGTGRDSHPLHYHVNSNSPRPRNYVQLVSLLQQVECAHILSIMAQFPFYVMQTFLLHFSQDYHIHCFTQLSCCVEDDVYGFLFLFLT